MRRTPTRFTPAAIAACALLLGACASTNQRGGEQPLAVDQMLAEDAAPSASSGPGSSGPGQPVATGQGPGVQGRADDAPSGAATTGSGGSTAPSQGTGSATVPQSTQSEQAPAGGDRPRDQGRPVAMGPGVTEETITLGFQSSSDLQAGFAIVGASGSPPDEIAYAQAVVNWLNATGGIRGRKVEVVHHETNPASGSFASQAQAACSTFTEDNEVFAVVSSAVGGDDSLLACLADKGVPLIETNLWLFDREYYERYPNLLYRPGKIVADAWVRQYVLGLQDIGYFEGATLGLLRFDAPVFDRLADNVLFPTLEQIGIAREDVVERVVGSPGGISDFGSAGAEMSNAVLAFRAAGVDHVIMIENAGIMPFFFMQEAENQGYRPLYGLSSTDIPETQANQQEPAQLEGAVAIGWTPPNDVGHDDHPGGNDNYTLCRQIMSDAGQQNLSGFYVQSRCDGGFFIRAALERAPDLTVAGFAQGVAALGRSYLSPFTMGSSFGPGKPDGADVVRPLAYAADCGCFRYFGQPTRFR